MNGTNQQTDTRPAFSNQGYLVTENSRKGKISFNLIISSAYITLSSCHSVFSACFLLFIQIAYAEANEKKKN